MKVVPGTAESPERFVTNPKLCARRRRVIDPSRAKETISRISSQNTIGQRANVCEEIRSGTRLGTQRQTEESAGQSKENLVSRKLGLSTGLDLRSGSESDEERVARRRKESFAWRLRVASRFSRAAH